MVRLSGLRVYKARRGDDLRRLAWCESTPLERALVILGDSIVHFESKDMVINTGIPTAVSAYPSIHTKLEKDLAFTSHHWHG